MNARLAYDKQYFLGQFANASLALNGDFIPEFNYSDFELEFTGLSVSTPLCFSQRCCRFFPTSLMLCAECGIG